MRDRPVYEVSWHGGMLRPGSGTTKGALLPPRPAGLLSLVADLTRQSARRSGLKAALS